MASKVGPLGGDLSDESEALMNGISSLTRDSRELSLSFPLPCADTMRKGSILPSEIQKRALPDLTMLSC